MPDECCICLDEIVVATTGCVQLACSHTYHLGCISTWFQNNPSCPECRHKAVEKETPSTIYRSPFVWEEHVINELQANPPHTGIQVTNPPQENIEITEDDLNTVLQYSNASIEVARNALQECGGSVIDAILQARDPVLTMNWRLATGN